MHRTARLTFLMFMSATLLSSAFTISVYSALRAAPLYTTRDTSIAAPLDQQTPSAEDAGEEYIVQAGDSLYKISGQFYENPGAYQRIVDATNAKAAVDPRFTPIADPRTIQSGQRLWIPDRPDLPIVNRPTQMQRLPIQSLLTPQRLRRATYHQS
ncbi:MAG: LysM peptidoglycan-binding domain-containing protein [Caldilineaceae bacterium]